MSVSSTLVTDTEVNALSPKYTRIYDASFNPTPGINPLAVPDGARPHPAYVS